MWYVACNGGMQGHKKFLQLRKKLPKECRQHSAAKTNYSVQFSRTRMKGWWQSPQVIGSLACVSDRHASHTTLTRTAVPRAHHTTSTTRKSTRAHSKQMTYRTHASIHCAQLLADDSCAGVCWNGSSLCYESRGMLCPLGLLVSPHPLHCLYIHILFCARAGEHEELLDWWRSHIGTRRHNNPGTTVAGNVPIPTTTTSATQHRQQLQHQQQQKLPLLQGDAELQERR